MSRRVAWMGGSAVLCAVCMLVWLALPAGAQSQSEGAKPRREAPGEPPRPPAKAPTTQESPAPTREIASLRFEATVFAVEAAPEHVADLDAKTLTAEAASPAKLAQSLQKLGVTSVLYRVDQVVTADGGRQGKIEISQDTPYLVAVPKGDSGGSVPSVSRQHVGASFEVFATNAPGTPTSRVQATVKIDVSAMTSSGAQVGSDTAAPTFWHVSQSYGGPTDLGKPVVLVSADGSRGAGAGRSVAFVTLLQMSNP